MQYSLWTRPHRFTKDSPTFDWLCEGHFDSIKEAREWMKRWGDASDEWEITHRGDQPQD